MFTLALEKISDLLSSIDSFHVSVALFILLTGSTYIRLVFAAILWAKYPIQQWPNIIATPYRLSRENKETNTLIGPSAYELALLST
jgi:hypothetical protein